MDSLEKQIVDAWRTLHLYPFETEITISRWTGIMFEMDAASRKSLRHGDSLVEACQATCKLVEANLALAHISPSAYVRACARYVSEGKHEGKEFDREVATA